MKVVALGMLTALLRARKTVSLPSEFVSLMMWTLTFFITSPGRKVTTRLVGVYLTLGGAVPPRMVLKTAETVLLVAKVRWKLMVAFPLTAFSLTLNEADVNPIALSSFRMSTLANGCGPRSAPPVKPLNARLKNRSSLVTELSMIGTKNFSAV